MPQFCLLMQQIVGQILSLYNLSSLLRRSTVTDKYIRSVDSESNTTALRDPDALPPVTGLCIPDEDHIKEKVLHWRGLTKSSQSVKFDHEDPA